MSCAWHRIGGILVTEHLGATVLVDPYGFHEAQCRT